MAEEKQSLGFDEFPDDIREDVEGLIWLGHLEDDFEFAGHRFTIRTLKADEELYAGLLAKEYLDTMSQAKAWAWANIALCLVAVDGDEHFVPEIGPDRETNARGKFRYVTSKWYWVVGDHIFNRYLLLSERQLRAVEAVRDLSPRSQPPSQPSADSSTDQGDSQSKELAEVLEED
jgi:hypothetical protein